MHAISSYRGNRRTNKQRNTLTNPQTGAITIHCSAASAQCYYIQHWEIKHGRHGYIFTV